MAEQGGIFYNKNNYAQGKKHKKAVQYWQLWK